MSVRYEERFRAEQRGRAERLARVSVGLGVGVACVSALALAGWALQVQSLRAVVPGLATMKPDTAMGLGIVGIAVAVIARRDRTPRWAGVAARVGAGVVAGFMALTILEYLIHRDLGINVLVLRALGRGEEALTGRGGGGDRWSPVMAPAPATVMGILCAALGVAMLKDDRRARMRTSEAMAAIAGTIGLVALLGYAYGVSALYQFGLFFSTALHTAACLALLAAGIFLSRAESGAMGVMTSSLAGGVLARRLVPLTALAPLALAGMVLIGSRRGWYGESVSVAMLGVLCAVVLAAAAIVTASSLNRSDAARRAAESRQSLMMAELDHRVKNNLAAVLSLAELTIGSSGSLTAFSATFTGRLRAMARTHEALAATRWQGVRLRELVRMTVGPLADGGKRLEMEGPDVLLPSRASSAVCSLLHELATNAAKYGAFATSNGHVRVSWSVDEQQKLTLEWRETGVEGIKEPTREGFGTELIRGSVTHELQGEVELEYRPPGLRCRICAPLALVATGSAEEALTREMR